MLIRGRDAWPPALTGDLVEERHFDRPVRCYPPGRPPGLAALLDAAADRVPERDAVVDHERHLTWRQLRREVDRHAAALHRRHLLKPGERVALHLMNGIPFCVALFACARLGAIAVPVNTKLRAHELRFMLEDAAPRVFIGSAAWWPEVAPVRDALPCEAYYLVGGSAAGASEFESLLDAGEAPPQVTADEDATALIVYTSGTTGRPKGAELTGLGIVSSVMTYQRCLALGPDERSLVAMPMFHVTGLVAQLLTMTYLGGTTVIMPTFDPGETLALLDAARITHMVAAPTVYTMMMAQPDHRARGRALRTLVYGGAPMPRAAVRGLRDWLPLARLYNVYGLTETSSPATVLPDSEALVQAASVGVPVPTADVRIADPGTGADCEAGEVGEVLVRGPMVVPRYWNNPDATAQGLADGWLRTGDLARVGAGGSVTIMDRVKDMITRGGEKIFSVEVEEVLCGHPDVFEAAVVGVPDPVYGEAIKAYVVPRPGRRIDPDGVRRWVWNVLAKYKVPRDIVIVDALPRNPNGKVVKSALR
ncbi:MAG: acyl--CoA ligase [Candidatus Rokubacteria bacterium]|nr:acyl--CoA ligase [Candidatus Rokubacteria bacterium]